MNRNTVHDWMQRAGLVLIVSGFVVYTIRTQVTSPLLPWFPTATAMFAGATIILAFEGRE